MVQNTHNKNKKESKLRVATKLPWLPRGLVIRTKRKYMNRNIDYMKMNEVYKNLKSKKIGKYVEKKIKQNRIDKYI